MKVFMTFLFALIGCQWNHAAANDSAAAIGAGGVQFLKTEGIVMEKEDLFISSDLVKVLYVFKNISDHDITVDIFFPLPPHPDVHGIIQWDSEVISEMKRQESKNHPEHKSLKDSTVPFKNFSVLVDGKSVPFDLVERALQDTKDITDLFTKNQLPLSPLLAACNYPMETQEDNDTCGKRKERYVKLGLLSAEGKALWQKQVHYRWKQTFPKGKSITIEHSYRPARGSFFMVPNPNNSVLNDLIGNLMSYGNWMEKFSPWEVGGMKGNFIKWLKAEFEKSHKNKKTTQDGLIQFYEVSYILTTGANWDGPIRDFTLTLEHPKGGSILARLPFNQDQVKSIGNNRWQVHMKNFKPYNEVNILFAEPYKANLEVTF